MYKNDYLSRSFSKADTKCTHIQIYFDCEHKSRFDASITQKSNIFIDFFSPMLPNHQWNRKWMKCYNSWILCNINNGPPKVLCNISSYRENITILCMSMWMFLNLCLCVYWYLYFSTSVFVFFFVWMCLADFLYRLHFSFSLFLFEGACFESLILAIAVHVPGWVYLIDSIPLSFWICLYVPLLLTKYWSM